MARRRVTRGSKRRSGSPESRERRASLALRPADHAQVWCNGFVSRPVRAFGSRRQTDGWSVCIAPPPPGGGGNYSAPSIVWVVASVRPAAQAKKAHRAHSRSFFDRHRTTVCLPRSLGDNKVLFRSGRGHSARYGFTLMPRAPALLRALLSCTMESGSLASCPGSLPVAEPQMMLSLIHISEPTRPY